MVRRNLLAVGLSAVAFGATAAPALANDPVSGLVDQATSSVSNVTDQNADASAQSGPQSNVNAPVSVLSSSSGDQGDVSQGNAADNGAAAGNANGTGQSAGTDGGSSSAAENSTDQDATAKAKSGPQSNVNAPVSVLSSSSGKQGDVNQSNEASNQAAAGNANGTSQSADTTSGDRKRGSWDRLRNRGGSDRSSSTENTTTQNATAKATSGEQSNTNRPISILSSRSGRTGDVEQTNRADNRAKAGNANGTEQSAATRGGDRNGSTERRSDDRGDRSSSTSNDTTQDATAKARSGEQSNTDSPFEFLSSGSGRYGDVDQDNRAGNHATAGNWNGTWQEAMTGR